jgi:hypothetical protein
MTHRLIFCCVVTLFLVSCFAVGQDQNPVVHPNQEVRVNDLPVHTAQSADSTAVLMAALETIFHDPNVCCGKNSALQDIGFSASTLKDLAARLAGKHYLSDGRSITVTTEYVSPSSMNPSQIIGPLMHQQAVLMEWDSHLYVLYGAVFDELLYPSGNRDYVIHKLLLLDTRFSDARREASFNRDSDDWTKVSGLLTLAAAGH